MDESLLSATPMDTDRPTPEEPPPTEPKVPRPAPERRGRRPPLGPEPEHGDGDPPPPEWKTITDPPRV